MKDLFSDIQAGAAGIRREAKRLADLVARIDSDDVAVMGYAKRLKGAIFQSIDNAGEIERHGRFLANAERIASLRRRVEDARKEAKKRKAAIQTEEMYGSE